MMFSSARKVLSRRRIDDDLAAGETLAAIVVHVAFDPHRDARHAEGHHALAGRAAEIELDRVLVVKALGAVTPW